MAFMRFYNREFPLFRDVDTNEVYDRLFHSFNSGFNFPGKEVPAANISETEKEFSIEMALPGVVKENIQVKHENGQLMISILDNNEKKEKDGYTRREFDYSGTSRTFRTGKGLETEKITAKYENGILTVHLPKKENVTPPVQSIAIE